MSDSKKPGQTVVLYNYCGLSRFFWIRRKVRYCPNCLNKLGMKQCSYCTRAIISRSWIQAIHKDRIFWKNIVKNKQKTQIFIIYISVFHYLCVSAFFLESPPNIPQSDEKILMECDTANDCPLPELSNCNIMLTPTSSGKVVFSC